MPTTEPSVSMHQTAGLARDVGYPRIISILFEVYLDCNTSISYLIFTYNKVHTTPHFGYLMSRFPRNLSVLVSDAKNIRYYDIFVSPGWA